MPRIQGSCPIGAHFDHLVTELESGRHCVPRLGSGKLAVTIELESEHQSRLGRFAVHNKMCEGRTLIRCCVACDDIEVAARCQRYCETNTQHVHVCQSLIWSRRYPQQLVSCCLCVVRATPFSVVCCASLLQQVASFAWLLPE